MKVCKLEKIVSQSDERKRKLFTEKWNTILGRFETQVPGAHVPGFRWHWGDWSDNRWLKSSQKLMYVCFTEKSMTEKQNNVNKLTWLCLLLNYLIFQK